jgi:hypothetical protein
MPSPTHYIMVMIIRIILNGSGFESTNPGFKIFSDSIARLIDGDFINYPFLKNLD